MKKEELSLVIRKDNHIDKLIRSIRIIFRNNHFKMFREAEELLTPKRPDITKIIIPKEKLT